MSVLLCRQQAKLPYYNDKLNLRIWSEQELCYVIRRYPLIALDGLISEDLVEWIGRGLQMHELCRELRAQMESGGSTENMLLSILLASNYYTVNEINAYKQKLIELGRCSREAYLHGIGKAYFETGRLLPAYEKFQAAADEIDRAVRRASDLSEKEILLRKKALCYCDMACVRMHLFEEQKALDLLAASELFAKTERAERLRYLISGGGTLSDEEKQALDGARSEAEETAKKTEAYADVQALMMQGGVRFFWDAGKLLAAWKRNYRKML